MKIVGPNDEKIIIPKHRDWIWVVTGIVVALAAIAAITL